jgi:hypothetical protein
MKKRRKRRKSMLCHVDFSATVSLCRLTLSLLLPM